MQANPLTTSVKSLSTLLIAAILVVPSQIALAGSPIEDYLAGRSNSPDNRSMAGPQSGVSDFVAESHTGDSFILTQLYDDVRYLVTEPDFYGVVGGLAVTPSLFG